MTIKWASSFLPGHKRSLLHDLINDQWPMVILLAQNLVVFWRHYFRDYGFPWDFPRSYYGQTVIWTTLVSQGIRVEWIPFSGLGIPLDLLPQSGHGYPPLWIFPILHIQYSLKAAVIFQCVHVFLGAVEVFSFHATKFFNTFEGGAVVTNNDELASRIRLMTNFGFKTYDTVAYLETNGKMSEVSAAMGLTSLESLDEFISVNRRHYKIYQRLLSGVPGVKIIQYDEIEKNNYQYIVIEIDETITGISRDLVNDILHAENILSRRYFYPGCHQMEPYCSYFPIAGLVLPETEKLTTRVLQLPTGTAVSEQEINQICELTRFVLGNGNEIQGQIETQ